MADKLRYDNQVVVVTGAGNGLGKQFAKFFASRGAKIVVNDLGGTFNGRPGNSKTATAVADVVVQEIKDAGGEAVANYNGVQEGDKIIKTAIDAYGRVDVLINNAGILRDITLRNMKDEDWDAIMDVHLHGSMKTARAAWPYFRKQRYGRVINTSSSAGLFGNFGQSNYAAAKVALIGFTEVLAKEGAKYNICANVYAPGAASRLTQTVWPPEMMDAMKPDYVVPLVAILSHSSCKESGSIFEAAAGHFSKIRWERSKGFIAKPDDSLTPDVILRNWDKVIDFRDADHPNAVADGVALLEQANKTPSATRGEQLDFRGKVALVTGAGAGLGRAYAMQLAKLGAKVVVNDLKGADDVVKEIKDMKGEAVAINKSVEDGDAIVKFVVDTYGRIDIVVNNAGILRDKAFQNMTDDLWYPVLNIHLRGTYKIQKAAWPHFLKQKYGRVVNITSTSGIYGNYGQSNYSTAKAGIIGFTKSTAREGAKYNIIVNAVAPSAGTDMTRTIWADEQVTSIRPEFVAPIIAALCSEKPPASGQLFEAGSGCFSATRWQRARGYDFEHEKGVPEVEAVAKVFDQIIDFDNGQADNPESPTEGSKYTIGNVLKNPKLASLLKDENKENRKYLTKIQQAKEMEKKWCDYSYTARDVILYNIGLGAQRTDLPLVFEGSDNFHALPTFGIVPTYFAKTPWEWKDFLPNFDYRQLLHGEQFLEIKQFPIPTSGKLKSEMHLIEVVDKGNAAICRRGNTTTDASGKVVFYNESVVFIRKAGGFGGAKKPEDRGAATAANNPPSRSPDKVVEEKTHEDLAAIYRLSGDWNPLHIDPAFSKVGGFETPILHGLATFGIAGKHVFQEYGMFKNIKVRFSGVVLPGETIVTEMWKEGGKVIFRAKVKETGKSCLSNAAVEVYNGKSSL